MKGELSGSVVLGEPNEVLEIIGRLTNLPEFGLHSMVEDIRSAFRIVADLEKQRKQASQHAHNLAEKLIKRVEGNWTPKEIYEATGYDNPDEE